MSSFLLRVWSTIDVPIQFLYARPFGGASESSMRGRSLCVLSFKLSRHDRMTDFLITDTAVLALNYYRQPVMLQLVSDDCFGKLSALRRTRGFPQA